MKTPLEIRLVPTGIVSGRVLEGNEPVMGANIELSEPATDADKPGPHRSVGDIERAKTDENGRFEFPLAEANRSFQLSVVMEGYKREGRRGQVAAGQTLEIDPVSLTKLDKSVAGTVVDLDGNPVAGVSVRAEVRSGMETTNTYADPFYFYAYSKQPTGKNGRFTIRGVLSAPLMLLAHIEPPQDSKDRRIHYSKFVEAQPDQTDVRIVLDPKLVRGNTGSRQ